MGMLEDELRDILTAQAARPPAMDDPAGRAIRTARRIIRRRMALGVTSAVVSLLLISVGVVAARLQQPGPVEGAAGLTTSGPEVWQAPLPAEVLVGNQIILATGTTISLAAIPSARRASRVPGGWLVQTWDRARAAAAVWFVAATSSPVRLAEGAAVALGRQAAVGSNQLLVAWGGAGRVSVASFANGQLHATRTTTGTGSMRPLAIVGSGVLLAAGPTGAESYDMWFPSMGDFVSGPTVSDPVIAVTGDGASLFGLTEQGCLALIAPAKLAVTRSSCNIYLDVPLGDLGLPAIEGASVAGPGAGDGSRGAGGRVSASPDGRWLVALTATRIDLYDLARLWTAHGPVATWPVGATGVAWLADGSFVVVDGSRVIRLRVNDPGREEVTVLAVAPGQSVAVISDLRD